MDSVNHGFRIFHCCKCLRFREEEVWSDDYCFSLGLIDSSGLRFHYTKQLRKYESGVLLVGADVNRAMLIPPRQKNWKINSFVAQIAPKRYCHLPLFALQRSLELTELVFISKLLLLLYLYHFI